MLSKIYDLSKNKLNSRRVNRVKNGIQTQIALFERIYQYGYNDDPFGYNLRH